MKIFGNQKALKRNQRNKQVPAPNLTKKNKAEPAPDFSTALPTLVGLPFPETIPDISSFSHSASTTPVAHTLPDTDESLTGIIIDKRFKILTRLGKGGMSQVYKAEHLVLQKVIALKMLHPQEASKENIIERFQQEAKALSTLDHPNIVKVHACGLSEQNQFYLAMDFLDGSSLAAIITAEGHIGWKRAVCLAQQIVDGLVQAHSRGIIHRDLKPSNIIVQRNAAGAESAKIVDFGIARLSTESGTEAKQLTAPGNTCGSPPYMSPEQCMGKVVDARSDIYSFGCLMYEVLTGKRPFYANTLWELMQMQVEQEAQFFISVFPQMQIPQSLEAIIRKCMAKNPALRYQSTTDLSVDLMSVGSNSNEETILQEALRQEARVSLGHKQRFGGLQKCLLLGASVSVLVAAGAYAYLQVMPQYSELNRLRDEIAEASPADHSKMKNIFLLVQKLLDEDAQATSGRKATVSKDEIVIVRLGELQDKVHAMPLSLKKCQYQAALVRFFNKLCRHAEARKLCKEALDSLEIFIKAETAKFRPDKKLIEIASWEAVGLCGHDQDKQDRLIGKYNILISIYVAEGRFLEAEHIAAAELAIEQDPRRARTLSKGSAQQKLAAVLTEIGVRQNLASVLMHESKFKEAENQLVQAWKLSKSDNALDSKFLKNVSKALLSCYVAAGKNDKASKTFKSMNQ